MNTKTDNAEDVRSMPCSGADQIRAERERQIAREGWSETHDDEHRRMELARAAGAYVLHVWERSKLIEGLIEEHLIAAAGEAMWPWECGDWKPTEDPVRALVKAGALLAAEIDRLDRERARHPNAKLCDAREHDL